MIGRVGQLARRHVRPQAAAAEAPGADWGRAGGALCGLVRCLQLPATGTGTPVGTFPNWEIGSGQAAILLAHWPVQVRSPARCLGLIDIRKDPNFAWVRAEERRRAPPVPPNPPRVLPLFGVAPEPSSSMDASVAGLKLAVGGTCHARLRCPPVPAWRIGVGLLATPLHHPQPSR